MQLSNIYIDDINKALKKIPEGSVRTFFNEIKKRQKEIEYIQNNMILNAVFFSDTFKLKNDQYTHSVEIIVPKCISSESLREKINFILLDFVPQKECPKSISVCDWYNIQKSFYSSIDVDNILSFFNEDCNYNCFKEMNSNNPFGLSVRLTPMREKINVSIDF